MAHPNYPPGGMPPRGMPPMMPYPGQPGPPGFMPPPMYGMMPPGMPPMGHMPYGMPPPPFHHGPPGFMQPRPMAQQPPYMQPPAPAPMHAVPMPSSVPPPQQFNPLVQPPTSIPIPLQEAAAAVAAVTISSSLPSEIIPELESKSTVEHLPDWLPPNCKQMVSVVLIALPKSEEMCDDEMKTLLSLCGPISRYDRKRSVIDAKPLDMGIVTFVSGLGAMRCMRLLQGVELGKGNNKRGLIVKLGSRELMLVDDAEDARKMHVSMGPMMPSIDGDNATVNVDQEAVMLEEIQDNVSNFLAGILANSLNTSVDEVKKEPVLATPVKLLERDTREAMTEDEAFEMSLAVEVEQFRVDQRKRDEALEKDRKARLRKRVQELKQSQAAASASTSQVVASSSSQPTTSSSHPMADQLSSRKEGPEVKKMKYESGPVISAAPVLNSNHTPSSASSVSVTSVSSPVVSAPPSQLPSFGMSVGKTTKLTNKTVRAPLKQASSLFSEEVVKKRELVKIDDEEVKESESARDRRIAESLPTNQSDLFNYPICWDLVDTHQIVTLKLKKWVCSKIDEYLGEEEATLIDFVIGKLKEHSSPMIILDELKLVLEDDAQVFVVKLWKILAFHSAKLKEDQV